MHVVNQCPKIPTSRRAAGALPLLGEWHLSFHLLMIRLSTSPWLFSSRRKMAAKSRHRWMPGSIWIFGASLHPHRFLFLLVYLRLFPLLHFLLTHWLLYYKNKMPRFFRLSIPGLCVTLSGAKSLIDSTSFHLAWPIAASDSHQAQSVWLAEPTSHGLITHSISTNLLFPQVPFR